MKKNIYCLLISFVLILSCSTTAFNKENNAARNIVAGYIEFRNQQKVVSPKTNIIIIGAQSDDAKNGNYWIDLCFVNPALLMDFKYSKVYEINGYKLIISEDLDKSYLLENTFKEVPYENLNLAKMAITYNTTNWHITLNSKNEVIEILPQEKSGEIKSLLEKKGVKFSKDYTD
ncbi:MAG: hypothetical protein ACN6OJ_08745 [Chryseobacterium sp.]|jgi:hypothetical protein|uniref:hypothetical protein n=1 Tax=Chryseobacterium sp. TaxID=1871047 RepID=UPI003D14EF6D